MRDLVSGKSSSSGSYSIGGSNPNMTEDVDDKTPTEKIKEIPEKVEVKKEDKVTSPMVEKEQLVPKMMVTNVFFLVCCLFLPENLKYKIIIIILLGFFVG